ncbi:MAG TPA: cellulase family glycosylhydrolase, partial [Polyangiaceae bacterium]
GSSDGTGSPGNGGASAGAAHASGAGGTSSTSGGSTQDAGASGSIQNAGAGGSSQNAGAGGSISSSGAGGSTAGAGAGGGKATVCNFASGLNVAWVQFAGDVPNPNLPTFKTIFKNTYDAGGRVIRWWFHTNGTVTPGYDSEGKALAIPQSHIDGVKALLAAADEAGVALVISLWSFDMLQDNAGAAYTNNQALLENDDNRQAYVDRYLSPLVTALKGSKGLYAYEIFNEPEGMGPNGWATHRTTLPAIQKTVNWLSAAIHSADPNVLVTSSAVTFDYCSKVSGKQNLYSDDALRGAGSKQNGTLDFYEVHYYTANGISNSAFQHPASYWGLDKKLVMGEFSPIDTDGTAGKDLGKYLYENGYSGAWSWSYNADWKWPQGQDTLQTLSAAHADVSNCPVK